VTAELTEFYGGPLDGACVAVEEGEASIEAPWRGPGRVLVMVRYAIDEQLTRERERPVFSYVSQRKA
jgi:hypothetical protein